MHQFIKINLPFMHFNVVWAYSLKYIFVGMVVYFIWSLYFGNINMKLQNLSKS